MSESAIRECLAGHELLSDLDPAFIDVLAGSAELRQFAENEIVFRHGDAADHFYIVRSGRITVEVPAIEGPPLELQNLGEGAVLGWSWLIPPYEWSFQARAVTAAELVEFDGAAIREHAEADQQFGYAILKCFSRLMSVRLEHARRRMMDEWRPSGFA